MKNNQIITIILVAIIVALVAFFGCMQYQKNQKGQFAGLSTQNARVGAGRFGGGPGARFGSRAGMAPAGGSIVSVDANSLTVKMPDGSSKIIILSDKTIINKTQEGSKSDLKSGIEITAFGTSNSDGSITAQNINIGGMMFRTFSPSGQPNPAK